MANPGRFAHRAFLAGTALKGLDGCLELLGGIILLTITRPEIRHMIALLTREEFAEDPSDFLANHAAHMAQQLTSGTQHFVAAYLLAHGAIKVALVAGLLRGVRWVFPLALGMLTAFIGYQVWRLMRIPSWALGVFTLIDMAVIALIWHEWRHLPSSRHLRRDTEGSS